MTHSMTDTIRQNNAMNSLSLTLSDTLIIILSESAAGAQLHSIDNLLKTTPSNAEIYFIDTDDDTTTSNQLRQTERIKTVLPNGETTGEAINALVEKSVAEYIVILQPNLQLPPQWLRQFVLCLQADSAIGVVGPVTNMGSEEQQLFSDDMMPEAFDPIEIATEMTEGHAREWREVSALAHFCVITRREIFDEIHGMRPEFLTSACVSDFVHRCHSAGYKIACAEDTYVHRYQTDLDEDHPFLSEQKAVQHLIEGDKYLQNEALMPAVIEFSLATEQKPDYSAAMLAHATTLAQSGQLDEAYHEFLKITALNPENAEAQNNLGFVCFSTGKFDEAEQAFLNAAALIPDAPDIRKNLAEIYHSQERYQESIEKSESVLQSRPEDIDSLLNIANCHHQLNDPDTACQFYEKVLQIEPNNETAQNGLSQVLNNEFTPSEPVEIVEDLDLLIQKGAEFANQGNYKQAAEIFRNIVTKQETNSLAWYNLSLMQIKMDEIAAAVVSLHKAIEVDAEFPEAHNRLGLIHMENNDYKDALAEFRMAIAKNIQFDEAYQNYEKAAQALGMTLVDTETDIVFYTAGIPFNGNTIYETGLGGSESSLFFVAREFARLGYRVHVFNNCDQPGTYENVKYDEMVDFHIYSHFNHMKVFVSLRSLLPFKMQVQADYKVLWVQDNPNVEYLEGETLEGLDFNQIFTLSEFQTKQWQQAFGIPREKFFITSNGTDLAPFEAKNLPRNRNKLIYSSRPSRGLDVLLDIFPKIKTEKPEAELHLFTYLLKENDDEMTPLLAKTQQPGVFLRGSVSKTELAQEMLTARLMVYPSTFRETSCIAAIEAQAAGLPIVTSNLAALPETIEHNETGIILNGDAHSPAYQEEFIKTVIRLMDDNEEWARLSANGIRRAAKNYAWPLIAKTWESLFSRFLENAKNDPDTAPNSGGMDNEENVAAEFEKYLSNLSEFGNKSEISVPTTTPIRFAPESVESIKAKADQFLAENRIVEATEQLERIIKITPDSSDAYNNLGYAYFLQNNPSKAAQTFQRAIDLNPDNIDALSNLADLYHQERLYSKAFDLYQKVLHLAPNDQTFIALGDSCVGMTLYDSALTCYEQALKLNPENAVATQKYHILSLSLKEVSLDMTQPPFSEKEISLFIYVDQDDNGRLSAIINWTKELKAPGFHAGIVHNSPNSESNPDIKFYSKTEFEKITQQHLIDIFITVDTPEILETAINAKSKILWITSDCPDEKLEIISSLEQEGQVDYVLLSDKSLASKLSQSQLVTEEKLRIYDPVQPDISEFRDFLENTVIEMTGMYADWLILNDNSEKAKTLLEDTLSKISGSSELVTQINYIKEKFPHLTDKNLYQQTYDKAAERSEFCDDIQKSSRFTWLLKKLHANPAMQKIVDVGCHKGEFSIALAQHGFRMTGVDIADQNIAVARQKAMERGLDSSNINFTVSFAEEVAKKFPENSFDGALVFEILEHVPDMSVVLKAVETIVRPGGTIIITLPLGFLEAAYREICQTDFYPREHVRHFTSEEIEKILGKKQDFTMKIIKAKTDEEKWFGLSYTVIKK